MQPTRAETSVTSLEHVECCERRGTARQPYVERAVRPIAVARLRQARGLAHQPVVVARLEAREIRAADELAVEQGVDIRVRVDEVGRPENERDVPWLALHGELADVCRRRDVDRQRLDLDARVRSPPAARLTSCAAASASGASVV